MVGFSWSNPQWLQDVLRHTNTRESYQQPLRIGWKGAENHWWVQLTRKSDGGVFSSIVSHEDLGIFNHPDQWIERWPWPLGFLNKYRSTRLSEWWSLHSFWKVVWCWDTNALQCPSFLEQGQCILSRSIWVNKYTSSWCSGHILPEKLGTALRSQMNSALPPKLGCVVARKAGWSLASLIFHGTPEGHRTLVCAVPVWVPAYHTLCEKSTKTAGKDELCLLFWTQLKSKEGQGKKTTFWWKQEWSSTPDCTLVPGVRPTAGPGIRSAPTPLLCFCLPRMHLMSGSGWGFPVSLHIWSVMTPLESRRPGKNETMSQSETVALSHMPGIEGGGKLMNSPFHSKWKHSLPLRLLTVRTWTK